MKLSTALVMYHTRKYRQTSRHAQKSISINTLKEAKQKLMRRMAQVRQSIFSKPLLITMCAWTTLKITLFGDGQENQEQATIIILSDSTLKSATNLAIVNPGH